MISRRRSRRFSGRRAPSGTYRPSSTEAEKADLLATIIDESERLNRFIANLLDMTKLESGAVVPNTSPQDVREIVGSALRRATKILAEHRVELELAGDLPMLELDAVLFEQVLFNLLDNAAKYAPAGTTIRIRVLARWRLRSIFRFLTRAAGFRRAIWSTSSTSSTGRRREIMFALGLGSGLRSRVALSKPCTARSLLKTAPDRAGAVFTITLPIPVEPRQLDTAA